ncbi:hypothetical protein [Pyxidicoccus sp. MSG2]|uniref:hypothetical protein n=1 Tax=Pyxidicoccus sp. MSG2 TaxID=2996790 RepID=UPI00227173E9|nr:hypothetical protein [Pyxidicoccus sp. MSG2]MCY1022303.1 hypothetical protein [Pyxidicoccus sp. MSG2]
MHATPGESPGGNGASADGGLLSAHDLLAGSALVHEVAVPAQVLRPGSTVEPGRAGGHVKLRPLRIATLALILKASREEPSLVPLLMVKESLVEPALQLEQIRQLHAGLVHFLVARINLISGLDTDGDGAQSVASSPLGQSHLLLAKHFGWTPQQVAELTPGQVAVYLAGIERLLALDAARERGGRE